MTRAFTNSWAMCILGHPTQVLVRELAMMQILVRLTDEIDWAKKVWDAAVVEKWCAEAKAIPEVE